MGTVSFHPTEEFLEKADKAFETEKDKIQDLIPEADVQHIGSTSIPGSITKGDLDINVRVQKEDFEKAVQVLKGMYLINQPENWTESYASFKDDGSTGIDIGVQLTVIGDKLDDFLIARDILLKHPELLEEYNALKKKYEGKDMAEYRKEKGAFFDKLVNRPEYRGKGVGTQLVQRVEDVGRELG